MTNMRRLLVMIMVFCLFGAIANIAASASELYSNYIYDHNQQKIEEPQAYIPERIIDGPSLGIASLRDPTDLFVAPNGEIYIADTGNNRILVLSNDFSLSREIAGVLNGEEIIPFQEPTGIFVSEKGYLYVVDSGSLNVYVCIPDGQLVQIVHRPNNELLDKMSDYTPQKIAVDSYDRMYLVASGVNQGMVELNPDGSFLSFYGAVTTDQSFAQTLRRFLSSTGLDVLASYLSSHVSIPTEYSNLAIDERGFVYGVVSMLDSERQIRPNLFVQRLNPRGNDVLVHTEFPFMGDLPETEWNGKVKMSKFVDVAVRQSGIYSLLDSVSCRVFTYNDAGELMYVFGGEGEARGLTQKPSALDVTADGRYLVLDKEVGRITVYRATEYGTAVTNAVTAFYNRDYETAEKNWQIAMNYTASSELVINGVADSLYRRGEYKDAMQYYKMAKNQSGYSRAFEKYLIDFIISHFIPIIGIIVALMVIRFLFKRWKKSYHNKMEREGD